MSNLFDDLYNLHAHITDQSNLGTLIKFSDIRPGLIYKTVYIKKDDATCDPYNREPYILVSSIQKEKNGYALCGIDLCLLEDGPLRYIMNSYYDSFKDYVKDNSTKGISGFNDDVLMVFLKRINIPKKIIRKFSLVNIKDIKLIDYYTLPSVIYNHITDTPSLSKNIDIKAWRFKNMM